MRIADTGIATRIGSGFTLILAIMAGLIIIALVYLAGVGAVNDRIIEKEWVKTEAANLINTTTRANARRTLELFIAADAAEAARIYEHIGTNKKSIDEALATLDRLVVLPQGKELLGRLKQARGRYVASFTQVGALLKAGSKDEALVMMKTQTLPALDALQVLVSQLSLLQQQIVQASSAEIKHDIATATAWLIALGLAAATFGIGLAFWLSRSITGPVKRAVLVAQTVASGDLTSRIVVTSKDETGQLLAALQQMNASLVNIVGNVRSGTDTIATASEQIAAGNLDLSSRTEEQASSLEETASSLEELTSTVKQNADNARQANSLATSASTAASEGGAVVADVISTMAGINESARKIVDIISVIDGIAFQTNILALNAAVEAARAGEQGRGFAVVAAEVRTLAQRSAGAAKEIKALINDSVEKVDAGSRLVDQAGATMGTVVTSVQRVSDIISEITAASQEQSAGIEQINQAIMQMDSVTQQNAALVEEAAAAAESLQGQASNLAGVVSVFKLDAAAAAAGPAKVRRLPPRQPAGKAAAKAAPPLRQVANGARRDEQWETF